MFKVKFLISLALAVSMLTVQVGGAFAAPGFGNSLPITGRIHRITLYTDPNSGIMTVIVELTGQGEGKQVVRLSQETAINLKLVALDLDGLVINDSALGELVEIDPGEVLSAQGEHPVGSALATFFSAIDGLDYEIIMDAHNQGIGFGVIAQALWLTSEVPEGNLAVFETLLRARQTGDYTGFLLGDGTSIQSWGQLRRAILDGKQVTNLGGVMSDETSNRNTGEDKKDNSNKNKDKEKNKSGNGNHNGNNGNGSGSQD